MIPGELLPEPGDIELNAGLTRTTLTVANTGDRPIQVGSHFHFAETNDALTFDRTAARGRDVGGSELRDEGMIRAHGTGEKVG